MREGGRPPRRVFRADTPADVLCANLVLETLPDGENTLVFCMDKTAGERPPFERAVRAVAAAGPWARIVDVSGLPVNERVLGAERRRGMRGRALQLRDSVRILRQRVAAGLRGEREGMVGDGLEGYFDELFVTCLYHDDVRLFASLWPNARSAYYPHTLGSLDASELHQYPQSLLSSRGPQRTFTDFAKRLVWGRDAVPVRTIRLDRAFTFRHAPDWGIEMIMLAERLTRERLAEHASALPDRERAGIAGLAAGLGRRAGLLLLAADEGRRFGEVERCAHERIVAAMIDCSRIDSVLVKPHPRNSSAFWQDAMQALRAAFPRLPLVHAAQEAGLPIELIVAATGAVACGGLGSTSFGILKRTFGLEVYCAEEALLQVREGSELALAAAKAWIRDARDGYTPV